MRSGRDVGAHVDDDGAAGVGEVSRPRPRHEGVLRVPPVRARAVGRPGGHRVHRRRARRRVGGPERPPALRYKVRRDGLRGLGLRGRAGGPRSARGDRVRQGGSRRGAGGGHRAGRGRSGTSTPSARSPAGGPYARWVARYMATLVARSRARAAGARRASSSPGCSGRFGYGFEDLRLVLEPMGGTGADPVWSMGDDTPIPPLSAVPQSLYAYFRQRFAQVTNPPIDSLRESMVMSLRMHLGRRGSPLLERPSYARMLRLEHPCCWPRRWPRCETSPASRPSRSTRCGTRPAGRTGSVPRSRRSAARPSARRGAARTSSIISDRAADATHGADPDAARRSARCASIWCTPACAHASGLVAEAGDAFDIHHFATLIGYGAEAVHPWLALETLDGLFGEARSRPGASARPRRRRDRRPRRRACSSARRRRRACSRSCRRWASPR